MPKASKKILITGGGGFVAKNLIERLQGDYDIFSVDINDLNLLDSAKVAGFLKERQFDAIIHAANHEGASRSKAKDPSKILENNLKMFFNIVRCKDFFGKMFYFGSGAEFGRNNWRAGMGEDFFDQNVPEDQYGFSKYLMTKYAMRQDNIYNMRLFGVFGKYDDWQTRFIPMACCYAALGMPIKIEKNRSYDFVSVEDVVKVMERFLNQPPKQKVYNICTAKPRSYKEIAEQVIKISGKDLKIDMKDDSDIVYGGDNSRLLEELKGFQFSPFEKKLEELYYWYDANKNIIDKNCLL